MRKTLFAAFITLACVQMQAQTNDSIQHRIDSLENTVRELKATIDSNEKEKKDKSVWGRKKFLTIGYVSQSLSPKYGNDLEGSFGVSLTSGRTIYLHKKPIWGKLKFALDLGMDVNYTKYKDSAKTTTTIMRMRILPHCFRACTSATWARCWARQPRSILWATCACLPTSGSCPPTPCSLSTRI